MTRLAAVSAAVSLLGVSVAEASNTDLKLEIGKLNANDVSLEQIVTVRNTSDNEYRIVTVECGFLKSREVLAAERTIIVNLQPHQTAYSSVFSTEGKDADHTDCRIGEAR